MPVRLPAPAHLLDAIFQHTNTLQLEDRQAIIRFLSGTEPLIQNPPGLQDRQSTFQDGFNSVVMPVEAAGPSTASSSSATTRPRVTNGRNRMSYPIRQILLHEERRTELRPSPRPTNGPGLSVFTPSSSSPSSSSQSTSLASSSSSLALPSALSPAGPLLVQPSAQDEVPLKSYTIVDQIIFEMDYTTGCWRKLRRRIRMAADRRANSQRGGEQEDANGNLPDTSSTHPSVDPVDRQSDRRRSVPRQRRETPPPPPQTQTQAQTQAQAQAQAIPRFNVQPPELQPLTTQQQSPAPTTTARLQSAASSMLSPSGLMEEAVQSQLQALQHLFTSTQTNRNASTSSPSRSHAPTAPPTSLGLSQGAGNLQPLQPTFGQQPMASFNFPATAVVTSTLQDELDQHIRRQQQRLRRFMDDHQQRRRLSDLGLRSGRRSSQDDEEETDPPSTTRMDRGDPVGLDWASRRRLWWPWRSTEDDSQQRRSQGDGERHVVSAGSDIRRIADALTERNGDDVDLQSFEESRALESFLSVRSCPVGR